VRISHNEKDPHSKALEPDCLSPRIAITTRSLMGEGEGGDEPDTDHVCVPNRFSVQARAWKR
jgi:hypothetical protein